MGGMSSRLRHPVPWTAALLAVASLTLSLAAARPARACGATPTPTCTIASTSVDGEPREVPRDAPLTFRFDCRYEEPAFAASFADFARTYLPPSLQVRLRHRDTGEVVAGKTAPYFDVLAFVPDAPLAATSEYVLEAQLSEGEAAPGTEPTIRAFRTSASLLPALEATAPHALTVAWEDVPVTQCDAGIRLFGDEARAALSIQGCPGPYTGCRDAGTERVPTWSIDVGGVRGGAAALGHQVELLVTDRTPGSFASLPFAVRPDDVAPASHELQLYRIARVAEGARARLTAPLPASSGATTLCARARVVSVSGHALELARHCGTYDELTAGLALDTTAEGVQPAGGCSVGGLDAASASPIALALALLAVRRRRARSGGVGAHDQRADVGS